jgi:hypothetical protein
MKPFLLNLIKLKTFLLLFVLQSCFGGPINELDLLEIDAFNQLQILRDVSEIDTSSIDSCSIVLDTIIIQVEEKCI